jgi:hypothetical protein
MTQRGWGRKRGRERQMGMRLAKPKWPGMTTLRGRGKVKGWAIRKEMVLEMLKLRKKVKGADTRKVRGRRN